MGCLTNGMSDYHYDPKLSIPTSNPNPPTLTLTPNPVGLMGCLTNGISDYHYDPKLSINI